ncbi:MFS general substrate transporter [Tothia fuscella]|uniref:MFS general substrate transporter n=1 Tax=Tothia fuscella TaxID=1048955 RepID=A0A9P4TWX0_9PEZI|nr:MFS general substrate transporter [Tothia fuscella]
MVFKKSESPRSATSTASGSRQLSLSTKPETERPSAASSLRGAQDDDEPNWPREFKAYTTLLGCFFLMFNSWGLVNAYGTYASYYKEELLPDAGLLLLNLIGSTQSFFVLINSWWVGRLLDAGHTRKVLGVGWVMVSLGMFTLSLAGRKKDHEQGEYGLIWLTQGMITGLGMACFFVASSQIASTWFVKRKSFAIGIVASGASIAGLVYPFMIKYLIKETNFKTANLCVASVVCATALFSWVSAVPNPRHPLNKSNLPKRAIRRWVDPDAFRNVTYNWFVASIAFMFLGFYAVFFNLEEWAAHKKLGTKNPSPEQGPDTSRNNTFHTFIYLAVMNASSTIGRLSSGYLSDKFGALQVHAVVMTIGSILLYAFWTNVNTIAAALAFVIFFGAVSGAIIGLPPASVAHIIKLSPDAELSSLGHWTGMMYTVSAIPALVGPIIAGHFITRFNNNYITVQMWSATCLFISALCLYVAIWYSKHRKNPISRSLSVASLKNMFRTDSDEEKELETRSTAPSAADSQTFARRQSKDSDST